MPVLVYGQLLAVLAHYMLLSIANTSCFCGFSWSRHS